MNPAESVSDPECKFSMYDQPPGDIDLVMAIEVQLLIIPMDHAPHYVCHDRSIIFNYNEE